MPVRHKEGSKPYREELRASLVRLGARGDRLAELVARDLQQRGLRPRQAWRYAADLSQQSAAGRFNQVSGNPRAPMTGNRVGDYERWPDGGVRPTLAVLRILADVYGTTWDQLIDARDLAHMPERDRLDYLERGYRTAARVQGGAVSRGMSQRQGKRQARMRRDELVAVVADESQEFGEWVGMSEVADATIGHYQAQVRQLAKDFEYAPPFPLLLATRRLRDRVTSRLRSHQRLDQARDLYLLAAEICGLLAWMTGDLGNYLAADTHAWTAWMCAEQAGHDGARAWVRATQSKLAYWDGRYTESAQLAEDGLAYQCTDTARTFLALFRARALARAGRRDEAHEALAQAEAERERSTAPDQLGGVWGLTPGRYHGLAATTRMLLDEPAHVLSEAAQAITLSEAAPAAERHLYSEMLARIDAAHAHLRQPDLDGVAAALQPVLDLPAESRIDPVTKHLARFRRRLALPEFAHAPQARDLADQIEVYGREAIPRQITAG